MAVEPGSGAAIVATTGDQEMENDHFLESELSDTGQKEERQSDNQSGNESDTRSVISGGSRWGTFMMDSI